MADLGMIPKAAAKTTGEEDQDALDLDEEQHPDDVEEPLDVLLQERTAAATLEDDEEEVIRCIHVPVGQYRLAVDAHYRL